MPTVQDTKGDPSRAVLLLVFRVGAARFAISTRHVVEVARAIPLSVQLPGDGALVGMVPLRGRTTAVVDARVVFGVQREEASRRNRLIALRHDGAVICLLVDAIDGLEELTEDRLEASPAAESSATCVDYVARLDSGEIVGVVEPDGLLSGVGA